VLPQVVLALALAAPARCVDVFALADVHGQVAKLARLAAVLAPVRSAGPSLLLDAGDGLQGTLSAELSRGEAVVAGFGALGVDAAAIGNHDFDYGAQTLRERAAGAPYPFLAANLRDRATGRLPAWKNLGASKVFRLPGGLRVGVFGLSAEATPALTMPGNVQGLAFESEVGEAVRQAKALRAEGADLVVGIAHVGGWCTDLGDPDDLSSCDSKRELFLLARALPPGLVDAILGGHTHGFVNHRVNGVALVQAGSQAEAAGWLTLCAGAPARFHPPLRMASDGNSGDAPADARVAAAVAPFLAAADEAQRRPLGVELPWPLIRDPRQPSSFGSSVARALRDALRADFGLVNSGCLRADLAPGGLTFGKLYEALPFEDHLATVALSGAALADLLRALAARAGGFPQLSGLRFDGAAARTCDGAPLDPSRTYRLATNEFLAVGGDGTRPVLSSLPPDAVRMRDDLRQRDVFLDWLRSAPRERPGVCP